MELPPTRDLAIAASAVLAQRLPSSLHAELRKRTRNIQRKDERVLNLDASSWVGRTLLICTLSDGREWRHWTTLEGD